MNSILLTGLPRSGTTLLCRLLSLVPGVVALAEPLDVNRLSRADDAEATFLAVRDDIARIRAGLLATRSAPSKTVASRLSSNFMSEPASSASDASESASSGLRRSLAKVTDLQIDKPLDEDFALFVKHPALFSALLPVVGGRMPVRAIVRNPLDVLSSWQTIDFPVGRGRLPAAEAVDASLRAMLAAESDVLQRQCLILAWFFERFATWVEPAGTIRYEDLVADPARVLSAWAPAAAHAAFTAEIRPIDPGTRYARVDRERNAHALQSFHPAFARWYGAAELQPRGTDAT